MNTENVVLWLNYWGNKGHLKNEKELNEEWDRQDNILGHHFVPNGWLIKYYLKNLFHF